MNMYTNTKKTKKFILVLVLLLLFGFCYPTQILASGEMYINEDLKNNMPSGYQASNDEDINGEGIKKKLKNIDGLFANLLFLIERGITQLINNMFCDDNHAYEYYLDSNDQIQVKTWLSPESIIKGKFILFDADIFEEIDRENTSQSHSDGQCNCRYYDGDLTSIGEGRIKLREIVSGWYYALRNFAIVALLSVLVYVGIRMIISTIAQDKAKYKSMFKDWLVALCLVIFMHYIMIGILNVSGEIVNAIGTSGQAGSQTENIMKKIGMICSAGIEWDVTKDGKVTTGVRAILVNGDKCELYGVSDAFALELLLIVIAIFTIMFAIKYLKREFTIIFLILLGPITCITYPIDKISDGKAQAYNKWFSEFLYNVIIQPFHLLIYVVLVGSAQELANANIIYSLVCLGVMIPAEKFIKEMFGFKDKLGSPLGAAAAGAAGTQLFNMARNALKGKGRGGNGDANNKDNSDSPDTTPKTKDPQMPTPDGGGDAPQNNNPEGDNSPQDNNPEGDNSPQDGNPRTSDAPEMDGDDEGATGGASAAAAHQDSDDPTGDAELERLEEKEAEGFDLSDEEKQRLEQLRTRGKKTNDNEVDTAEGASAAAAHQDSDDPTGDAELERLEEKEAEGFDLSDEEKQRLEELRARGKDSDNSEETEDGPEGEEQLKTKDGTEGTEVEGQPKTTDRPKDNQSQASNNQDSNEQQAKDKEKKFDLGKGMDAVKRRYTRHVLRKNGAAGFGSKELAKARRKRFGKFVLRTAGRTIKGATTLAGGLAGTTLGALVGLASGKGLAGVVAGATAGAATGSTIAGGLANGVEKLGKAVLCKPVSYGKTFFDAALDKDRDKEKFMKDEKHIKAAERNFKKRYGRDATGAEITNELENMYKLKQYGVKDDEMEDAMKLYNNSINEYKENDDYKKKKEEYNEKAFNYAAYNTATTRGYSNKDFRDEKKVSQLYNNLIDQYKDAGYDEKVADATVRKIIQDAANAKGVTKVQFPKKKPEKSSGNNQTTISGSNQTVDVNVPGQQWTIPDVSTDFGTTELDKNQITRMNAITVRLHEQGYSDKDIQTFATSARTEPNQSADEIINNYAIKTEFLEDKTQMKLATNLLEKSGQEVTKESVNREMKQRLEIKETFNVQKPQDIQHIRKVETEKLSKTQVQVARDFAMKNKGQLNDKDKMKVEKQNLINELVAGGSSKEKAITDAENIVNLAGLYTGEVQRPVQHPSQKKGRKK